MQSSVQEVLSRRIKRKLIIPTATHFKHNLLHTGPYSSTTEREYQFLKEYCTVSKALTVALDILHGEDDCYYGTLLPTLEILICKLLALKDGLSQMTAGMPDATVQVL